jgi:DNA-binding Lrp family transcriptional regulator
MNLANRPALDQLLINEWQHDFPLCTTPFAQLGSSTGSDERTVLETYRRLQQDGCISRIGGIWGSGAGGSAMLCALATSAEQLEEVAHLVNAIPGVNHNYEREHRYNLWFVITGRDRASLHASLDALEGRIKLRTLRLPMVRPYRIDLGFNLKPGMAVGHQAPFNTNASRRHAVPPVQVHEERLAALVEEGLPVMPRPYDAWAQALNQPAEMVLTTLTRWLTQGTLRRWGVVVRHHDLGIGANAMTVIDVPDDLVDAAGMRLAGQSGITLCYRRQRGQDWPYNLYCMVHGHNRDTVTDQITQALAQAGVDAYPRQTLFSGRRFKQTGGSYFRDHVQALQGEHQHAQAA